MIVRQGVGVIGRRKQQEGRYSLIVMPQAPPQSYGIELALRPHACPQIPIAENYSFRLVAEAIVDSVPLI